MPAIEVLVIAVNRPNAFNAFDTVVYGKFLPESPHEIPKVRFGNDYPQLDLPLIDAHIIFFRHVPLLFSLCDCLTRAIFRLLYF